MYCDDAIEKSPAGGVSRKLARGTAKTSALIYNLDSFN